MYPGADVLRKEAGRDAPAQLPTVCHARPRQDPPDQALLCHAVTPLSIADHPFRAANKYIEMPAGLTIEQMLQAIQLDPLLIQHCHVEIDGVPLDPAKIHLIRPKPGRLVAVRVAPGKSKKKEGGGGGKNPLVTVAMIALTVAAIAVPALGLPLLATIGIGLALSGAAVALSMATAPQAALGNLRPAGQVGQVGRFGALGASPRVNDVRDSPSQFIEGARNSASPWNVVPDVLGRHRMVPPYAALPFTSAAGSAQYLHLLFAWSPGQLAIDDYRIGETSINEYEDLVLHTLYGTPTDDASIFNSIYTNDVAEETFSILLTQPAGYQVRTTAPEADQITVDLTFPQGLVRFDPQGNRQPQQCIVNIKYRVVGGTYVPPTVVHATFPMSWIFTESDNIRITFESMQTAALRHGITWNTPFQGQFEVAVARGSTDTTSTQIFDQVGWTALRRARAGTPINFPVPLARTAVRIKASDQLNNVVDTFSAVVHRVALDWSGGTWNLGPTSNPAAMFRHVLQGPSNRRPVPDSEIDIVRLQEWSDFCRNIGCECNMIVDFPTSVRELLQIVAGTGRASLDNVDGKWSVVIDGPRPFPVQHFTPRNSKGFSAEKLFPDRAHAWRVRFNDRNHNWRAAERIVYAEGFGPSNSTKFEQHDFIGVTSPAQAVHLATHQLRSQALQPEQWNFEVDFEHLVANRGDLVLMTHDVLLVGVASGRIKQRLEGAGGVILGFIADEELLMETGIEYGVSIRTVDNGMVTRQVTRSVGMPLTQVMFQGDLDPGLVDNGDLFAFGHLGAETVRGQIKRIKRSGDLAARLSVLPYTDALWNWVMPADFDPGMTPLFNIPAPVIQSVYTGGAALGREPDATLVRVVMEATPLGRADAILGVQSRPTTTGESYRTAEVVSRPESNIIVLGGMRVGETWDLRARWIVGPLQPGPFAYRSGVRIEGYADNPALTSLKNLTLSAIGGQALLRWDAPTELDARFGGTVVFRHSPFQEGATWANSTSIGQGVPARNQVASLPLKGGTYLARVISATGAPGAISTVSTKQASAHQFGLLLSFDEHPDWLGTHNGTEVGIGNVLQLSGIFVPVGGFGDLGSVAVSGVYDFGVVVDLLAVKRVRVTVRMDAASVNINDTIDDRLDLIDNWQDFDGGADQGEGDAQVWVRITDDAPGVATSEWAWIDETNWSDATGWTDMTEEGVVWKLYQRLESAEFEARGFDFQLRMASRDPAYNILVNELRVDFEEVV
jgi:hypothetical protein